MFALTVRHRGVTPAKVGMEPGLRQALKIKTIDMKNRSTPLVKMEVNRVDPRRKGVLEVVKKKKRAVGQEKTQTGRMQARFEKLDYGSKLNSHELRYARSLIDPFSSARIKIPNIYPIPTSTMSIHGQLDFTTNAAGKAIIVLQPWNLNFPVATKDLATDSTVIDASYTNSVNLYENLYEAMPASQTDAVLEGRGFTTLGAFRYKIFDPTSANTATNVNRLRVVNAGIKVMNSSAATSRSGTISVGHSLVSPIGASIATYRRLASTSTHNMDDPAAAVYVPHDPSCYNFFIPRVVAVYESFDLSTNNLFRGWFPFSTANDLFNTQFNTDDSSTVVPQDILFNHAYIALTGAASQPISIQYSLNYEIVPTEEAFVFLQPAADCKGNPQKAQEAISCAGRGDSFWDHVGSALKSAGGSALQALGNAAVDVAPELLAMLL